MHFHPIPVNTVPIITREKRPRLSHYASLTTSENILGVNFVRILLTETVKNTAGT